MGTSHPYLAAKAIERSRARAMLYPDSAIPERDIPRARTPLLQHVVDTYASEINKVVSVWTAFTDADLGFRPHQRSTTVEENFKHQLLSERRFFGEWLSLIEPAAAELATTERTVRAYRDRLVALASPRLAALASAEPGWWLTRVPFFDVERERIWIFWRRVLHTAHHRTQLTVYLRLLDRPVPAVYGPTADVSWTGADPTYSRR
jgi:uncharacterized damage-inducible protein DinB